MKIGLLCDFVASNLSIIGQPNRPACGTVLQRPLSVEQFRSAIGRSGPNVKLNVKFRAGTAVIQNKIQSGGVWQMKF
jgi:hypothetical protein